MTFSLHPEANEELWYSVEAVWVFISAVMHLRRQPDYWKQRQ
jgi:hypothetical protein